MMLVGLGYDVHRFKKGIPLVLGGVRIAHPRGLDGHSDADVIVHAVMDALLGAAGLSDIGTYFPNTDPRFRNISSMILLKEVMKLLKKERKAVVNVDVTVLAEEPILKPHVLQMKKNFSEALAILPARVGIKATTNEHMGFIGRGEGIAALAVCLLAPQKKK